MIRPLTNLNVKRLEYIFDPHGLPLVSKSDPELYTTSLLVRGGPGTGKTTLALALGQAIAADGEGLVVYLTTEFSPAEILYKAELLGLKERGVSLQALPPPKSAMRDAKPGSVLVDHVTRPATEDAGDLEPMESSASKKLFILESAWSRLGLGEGEERPAIAGFPVRALVIDAFILPDYGRDDAEVRSDLVAFIQALESVGVTPILVEEVAPDSPSWLPFLVDVVFELTHRASAEGHLERTLTCSKCRYGLASPGPHAYSLSNGQPALFPTVRHALLAVPRLPAPLRFALPVAPRERLWHLVAGHQVILNASGASSYVALLMLTPGAVVINVQFGFPCRITEPGGRVWTVDEHSGPSTLGWTIVDAARSCNANVVFFSATSRVIRLPSWRLEIERVFDALRHLGLIVVVHDGIDVVAALAPVASVSFYPGPGETGKDSYQFHQPTPHRFSPPALISALPYRPEERRTIHDGTWLASALVSSRPHWFLACAWIAGNTDALDPLESAILSDPAAQAHLAHPLVRARARWQSLDAADACVDRLTSRMPWVGALPGVVARTKAELRLDSDDPAVVDEGIARLRDVLASYALPTEQRPEIHYNLAVALELRGDIDGAIAALTDALADAPDLELARASLARLRPAPPPPVTSP